MKKKKTIKKVVIVILSLILTLILAAALVFQFVVKPYTKELVNAVDQLLQDEDFMGDLLTEIPATSDEVTPEVQEQLPEDVKVSEDLSQYNVNADGSLAQPEPKTSKTPEPKKPQSEYNSAYDYVKDNVDKNDFERGLSFASRIDIQYVLGLLKGGLTVPEKIELKAYLKERFTTSEINEGIALYNKYSYLLK